VNRADAVPEALVFYEAGNTQDPQRAFARCPGRRQVAKPPYIDPDGMVYDPAFVQAEPKKMPARILRDCEEAVSDRKQLAVGAGTGLYRQSEVVPVKRGDQLLLQTQPLDARAKNARGPEVTMQNIVLIKKRPCDGQRLQRQRNPAEFSDVERAQHEAGSPGQERADQLDSTEEARREPSRGRHIARSTQETVSFNIAVDHAGCTGMRRKDVDIVPTIEQAGNLTQHERL
jgi:hypothetical protein